ncbi:MAG: hypothetical protein WC692_08475 [Erythrobacter sp.]|jgi:hypothetical protein
MKTLFRHFLLLGVMLGLLWQGVAYAAPPCAEMQHEQSVAMAGMADCMDAEKQSRDNVPPCKDMKAGCSAMVGCASLAALETMPVAVALQTGLAEVALWPTSPMLLGRNEAPILEPPTILG